MPYRATLPVRSKRGAVHTQKIVEEFRDVLARRTAKLHQEAIAFGGQTGPDHIKAAAELHRLRIGCDNFLNVLMGNY